MKTTKLIIITGTLLLIGLTSSAHRFSVGIEGGLPLGDFGDGFNFGIGGSARYEIKVGTSLGITATAGWLTFGAKDLPSNVDASWDMIPILVGARYYVNNTFQEGFYAGAALGITASTFRREVNEITVSTHSTDFTFAPGIGYHFDYIDVGLNYNLITTEDNSSSYLGLRVAYLFGHKESDH